MLIVIVEFDIAPEDQAQALDIFAKDKGAARALPGCEAFLVSKVAGSETGMILLEEWADLPSFEAYKASEGFARVGKALAPLMQGKPRSRAFEAALAGP